MGLKFCALPTDEVRRLQEFAPDANGQPAERHTSDGTGNPCRHCLTEIPEGADMLVLAYRPFNAPQPYAEVGPLFLCGDECDRHPEDQGLPAMYMSRPGMVLRGYDSSDRIVYGTGDVAEGHALEQLASRIFENPRVAYIHMRSPVDTCFHCRIERAEET